MKRFFLLLSILALSLSLSAQSTTNTLHLTNGNIIKGQIVNKSDSHIKIKSTDDEVFVFHVNDIKKIISEDESGNISEIIPEQIHIEIIEEEKSEYAEEASTNTLPNNSTQAERIKKIAPKKRRGYIGQGIGISVPIGSDFSQQFGLGGNHSTLNFAYVNNNHVGFAAILSEGMIPYNNRNLYLHFNLFLGLILSPPMGEKLNLDIRFLPGLSTLCPYEGGTSLAFDLGLSLRFHVNPYIDISLNTDLILSEFSTGNSGFESPKLFSAGIGVAYRLK